MTTATPPQNKRWQEIVAIWQDNRWLFALSGWLLGLVTMGAWQRVNVDVLALLHDLVPEAVGIVFTVLILERFAAYRTVRERKAIRIAQVKHPSNDFAVNALVEIKEQGWWDDMRNHYCVKEGSQKGRVALSAVKWAGGVDLSQVNLQNADLFSANLEAANLQKANLEAANLVRTNLQHANLSETDMRQTNLCEANLQHAILFQSQLQVSDLSVAQLQSANLMFAKLQDTSFGNANLQYANLWEANLQGADLASANLEGANLSRANLQQVWLLGTNLQGANLLEANLRGVHDIGTATFSEKSVLPDAREIGKDDEGNIIYDKYWTPETDMNCFTDPNHPDFWQPEWVKQEKD